MIFRRVPLKRNWAVPPGDIIGEYIEYYKLTNLEFAKMCGCSPLSIIDIVHDHKPLKRKLAEKFARVVDIPADALMRIEENYRQFEANRMQEIVYSKKVNLKSILFEKLRNMSGKI